MTTDDKIRDAKMQNDINREAAKISALSSGKIDKYEYLTGKEILPFNRRQIVEQAKFSYSPFRKSFSKTNRKMVGAIESLDFSNKKDELKKIEGIFPQSFMNDLIRPTLKEIVKLQDIIKKGDLNYQNEEKLIILVSIYYLLFFKGYT